jgi:hypothetical protein
MIYQISPVKDRTVLLPKLSKGLIQARHIQARLKKETEEPLPPQVEIWSPFISGPFVVPVLHWIE